MFEERLHRSLRASLELVALGVVGAGGGVGGLGSRAPTVGMLALSSLPRIGMSLVAEGMGQELAKGYIYFAMAFSIFVEMLNQRVTSKKEPVHLRGPALVDTEGPSQDG